MQDTGVYAIQCTITGKIYVGSAARSLVARWKQHQTALRNNKHFNRYLQAAWNKHKEKSFMFMVLEYCDSGNCIVREQRWIDKTRCTNEKFGYNLSPTAGSPLGLKRSIEFRKKMSAIAKVRGISPETLAKAHAATKGKPLSDERKAKQGAALRGRKHGPERIAKQSAALRGFKHSDEVKAYMSACQKGKKHSEETKAKMSATRKGRKYSEEHRKAISEGHRRRRERLAAEKSPMLPFMKDDADLATDQD